MTTTNRRIFGYQWYCVVDCKLKPTFEEGSDSEHLVAEAPKLRVPSRRRRTAAVAVLEEEEAASPTFEAEAGDSSVLDFESFFALNTSNLFFDANANEKVL